MGSRPSQITIFSLGKLKKFKLLLTLAGLTGLLFWAGSGGSGRIHAQDKGTANYGAQTKTSIAFSSPIPGAGSPLDIAALVKIIDTEINVRLQKEKLKASPRCEDAEFIRRVHLDLIGVIPTPDRVKAFLASKDPNKREKLIDGLLANPRFGQQLSEIWMHEIISPDPDNRFLPTEKLRKWLEDAFNSNKPWSKTVEELVTSTGTTDTNPATMFFVANSGADRVTGQVSRLFLGVQLQCAQCHNHPFTDWKQDEYWGMAAFFTKVRQDGNPKKAAKEGSSITVSESAAPPFVKGAKKKKGIELPEGFKNVPAKFLAGERPTINGPARPVLARWLTSPDNPYFAKALVNRLWANFFGRGFVNPIDDMHDGNPATHSQLLLALEEQFKRHDFDLKYLAKAIMLSEAYQRTSKPVKGNEADTEFFSRMFVRALSAEQLFDSIVTVVGVPPGKADFVGKKAPLAAGKKGFGGSPREQFIRFFHVEEGSDPLEYQDGIPQALRMMNSPMLNAGGKTLEEALRQKATADAITYVFAAVLSRSPTGEELRRYSAHLAQQGQRTGLSDLLWVLLNSSEFRLIH